VRLAGQPGDDLKLVPDPDGSGCRVARQGSIPRASAATETYAGRVEGETRNQDQIQRLECRGGTSAGWLPHAVGPDRERVRPLARNDVEGAVLSLPGPEQRAAFRARPFPHRLDRKLPSQWGVDDEAQRLAVEVTRRKRVRERFGSPHGRRGIDRQTARSQGRAQPALLLGSASLAVDDAQLAAAVGSRS